MNILELPPATDTADATESDAPGFLQSVAFHAGNLLAQIIRQRPAQISLSALVGAIALIAPIHANWRTEIRIATGIVALGSFATGSYLARQWVEEEAIAQAVVLSDKLSMAEELAVVQEAKAIALRQQYGLPNPVAELEAMQAQMQQALAQAEAQQGNTVIINGQPAPQNSEIFPLEDLAQTIADSPSDESNFLFVGKSRSGKTSIIVNTMAKKPVDTDWYIFNGKPEQDNNWGGLTASPYDYWSVNGEEKAIAMLTQFRSLVRALQGWQDSGEDHYPMFVVADEINNQRLLLNDKNQKVLDKTISLYSTQCMSERSGLWISTHTHNVDAIGLDKKLQTSFQVVALGREGKYGTLEACIDDRFVVRSKRKRDELREKLDAYVASGGNGALAFTDQGGDARIVRLPHYSKNVQIGRSPLNQTTSQMDDDEWREPQGAQSDRSPEPEKVEAQLPPQPQRPVNAPRPFHPEQLPEMGLEFLQYLSEKRDESNRFNVRILFKHWGKRRFDSTKEFKYFLAKIGMAGGIKSLDADYGEIELLVDF